jgi:glyceraldehyde 3-phosphate dehydrogenase
MVTTVDPTAGRLGGVAVRVPVENGSLTDLTVTLERADLTADDVNRVFGRAAAGSLAGYVRFGDRPIVSRDVVGDPPRASSTPRSPRCTATW